MRFPAYLMMSVALLGGPAGAADLEPASRIDSVVLHPDGAVVTRISEVDMPEGTNNIVFKGLPAALDPSSIRVEGAGDAAFVILGVEVRSRPGDADPVVDRPLDEKIEALKDEAASVAGRIEALDRKKATIAVYAAASPEKLSVEAKPLDVSQWSTAWDAIGEGMTKVNEDLRMQKKRAGELADEIATLEAARPDPVAPGEPKNDLAVALESGRAVRGTLRLSYQVSGANWTPLYDARLNTGDTGAKPSLTLVRRASLTQLTGEDWENVRLSVSTIHTRRGTDAPDLPAVQARLQEVTPYDAAPRAGRAPLNARQKLDSDDRRRDFAVSGEAEAVPAQAPAPVVASERTALQEGTGFTVVFGVPGRVSVPADGSIKTFLIESKSFEPVLFAKSAPVVDASAYIETSFVLQDEAPIFPGEVTLQRDGVLVGSGSLPLVPPGEKVELGFGVDDRIKVTRTPLQRRKSEPGLFGSNKSDVLQFKTVVKNLHDHPVQVQIVDRLPYSENEVVQVEMSSETAAPSEKDLDGRRGVLRWDLAVPAGGEKEIRFGYTVKWPADRQLVVQ